MRPILQLHPPMPVFSLPFIEYDFHSDIPRKNFEVVKENGMKIEEIYN